MVIFSECKHFVKYSGMSIEIATINGPTKVPISIQGVKIKPELLQSMGSILTILDWLQFTECQRICALKKLKNIPEETIVELILQQDEDSRMIASIAIISMAKCTSTAVFEKVLSDWIAATLSRVRKARTRQPQSATSGTESSEKEIETLRARIDCINGEIGRVGNEVGELTEKLNKLKKEKEKLVDEKGRIESSLEESFLQYPSVPFGISGEAELENLLSKATSAFPYLSQAMDENRRFSIKKSLKTLARAQ